jgi:Methyl-accepting chemotaxis protein (MCP) signaling domain.
VRSIAAASEEQSASAEEISRAVSHVRQVSDQMAQDMAEAQETVNKLTRLADELTEIITKMQTC